MAISNSNKGSYFILKIEIIQIPHVQERTNQLVETEIDIILAQMTATANVYKFEKNASKHIYLFSTSTRKRKGQLEKLIEKNKSIHNILTGYKVEALLKTEFLAELKIHKNTQNLVNQPTNFDGYSGIDLQILEHRNGFYDWQRSLWDMLFYNTGQIRAADSRTIINILDKEGCTGKSKLVKKMFYENPDDVGIITFGTTSQLNSSIVNLGPKKIYIIDITRSRPENHSDASLISSVEDCKNGLVAKMMYGEGSCLLMDPPHIVIMSNYEFERNLLSKDRWRIFEIKDKKLNNISNRSTTSEKKSLLRDKEFLKIDKLIVNLSD